MTAVSAGYRPMRNDPAGFDPMGEDWGYILDDVPAGQWRELVAVCDRRETWPFQIRGASARPYKEGYWSARLSPDWCFLAWGREYIGATWDPDRPHEVSCRITVTRRAEAREGTHDLHDWAGVITLDLREQEFTYRPCRRDQLLGVPAGVTSEAEHKARKLLAFFNDAIRHWHDGDQSRPASAADLYKSLEGPQS